jgi:hypothetical protein
MHFLAHPSPAVRNRRDWSLDGSSHVGDPESREYILTAGCKKICGQKIERAKFKFGI